MSEVICAISTPPGMGAIAVIRLSGEGSIVLTDKIFTSPSGKKLSDAAANTVHFGQIFAGDDACSSEVLVTVFGLLIRLRGRRAWRSPVMDRSIFSNASWSCW